MRINRIKVKNMLVIILLYSAYLLLFYSTNYINNFFLTITTGILSLLLFLYFPGFLILKIFNNYTIRSWQFVIYAIGISIFILMTIGFFINRFERDYHIVYFMIIFFICMGLSIYIKSSLFNVNHLIIKISHLLVINLLLWNMFFISLINISHYFALAVYLINLVIIYVSYAKGYIYKELILYNLAISLLLTFSLSTSYVNGFDIHTEIYFINTVLQNGFWDINIAHNYNSCLSIVILVPLLTLMTTFSVETILRLIYPLLFGLVPVGLYIIWKDIFSENVAFLSAFLFCSMYAFYAELTSIAKQQIGELYLVMILLLFFNSGRNKIANNILLIIATLGLIISHYGTSVIFFSLLAITIITYKLLKKDNNSDIIKIRINYLLLFTIGLFAWSMYISSSSTMLTYTDRIELMLSNLISDFGFADNSEVMRKMATSLHSPLDYGTRALYILIEGLISFGIVKLLINKTYKLDIYSLMTIFFYSFLVSSIIIPHMSMAFNTTRIIQLSLFFLAPLAYTGFKWLAGNAKKKWVMELYLGIIIVFYLFNLQVPHFIFGSHPQSIPIAKSYVFSEGDNIDKSRYLIATVNEYDVSLARWIGLHNNGNKVIYADSSVGHALHSYGNTLSGNKNIKQYPNYGDDNILILGYCNIFYGILPDQFQPSNIENFVVEQIKSNNVAYFNGWSYIVLKK